MQSAAKETRALAFYLPQFHPIPENNAWWGQGFTEWTNVAKARPLFRGHYQPHLPADLGFYDLRLPEAREAQADLARAHGIHGFCYYHYWFGGRRLLERPFNEVLATGRPDFPFCLCWANENWSRNWDGGTRQILVEQAYRHEDDLNHIQWLLNVFQDPRYIRVNGRPLLLVYRASLLPEPRRTIETWRNAARSRGFPDLYLCRVESFSSEFTDPASLGFDAAIGFQPDSRHSALPQNFGPLYLLRRIVGRFVPQARPNIIYDYSSYVKRIRAQPEKAYRCFPCVAPGWDNSPRRPRGSAFILHQSKPEVYESWLRESLNKEATRQDESPSLVFINAWNEWAEGCHLEPDSRFGHAFLDATRRALAARDA